MGVHLVSQPQLFTEGKVGRGGLLLEAEMAHMGEAGLQLTQTTMEADIREMEQLKFSQINLAVVADQP
jgi:hypothetical protein